MTSHGVPPDAPPGQERWPGHWTPSVEAEPLRHTLPAGALHGLQAALPLTENVPNSHTVQSVSPSPAVYLPEGHTVHVAVAAEVDPEGPCLPAAHAAPEHVEAPEDAPYFPAGQSSHVAAADEVAPSCAYVPAAHREPAQEDAPEVKKRVDVHVSTGRKSGKDSEHVDTIIHFCVSGCTYACCVINVSMPCFIVCCTAYTHTHTDIM